MIPVLQDVSWAGLTVHVCVVVVRKSREMSVVIEYHSGSWNFTFSQTRGVVILFPTWEPAPTSEHAHHNIPVQSIYS